MLVVLHLKLLAFASYTQGVWLISLLNPVGYIGLHARWHFHVQVRGKLKSRLS